jgi:two-component system cell cycle response regulator
VIRVLVVDDSPSVRGRMAAKLREATHTVEEAATAEEAFERAVAAPPDVVITDLVMPGLSGVQLCRVLRAEPVTAHVPVVLLTASGDRKSRFWARSAGAAAYVSKDRLEDAVALVPGLAQAAPKPARSPRASRHAHSLQERISSILDDALFESVVAGQVRALASAGNLEALFEGLVALAADVLGPRWTALLPERDDAPLWVHGASGDDPALEAQARTAVGGATGRSARVLVDPRAIGRDGPVPRVVTLSFAGGVVGRLAVAPGPRGFGRDDERVLSLIALELGGPLQMTSLYEESRRLARTDALTGLLNRRAFLDALALERSRSTRHVLPMTVLLLDVDNFKAVNDTHGHAAGDTVLSGVARTLVSIARKSDLAARWGGEEFVLALPHTGPAGGRIAAERIRKAIAETLHAVAPNREPLRVTASVGVASSEAPWDPDTLLAAADEGMYLAKARGKNRVEIGAPEPTTETRLLLARARLSSEG